MTNFKKLKRTSIIVMVLAMMPIVAVLGTAVQMDVSAGTIAVVVSLWVSGALFGDSLVSLLRVQPLLEREAHSIELVEEAIKQRDAAGVARDNIARELRHANTAIDRYTETGRS